MEVRTKVRTVILCNFLFLSQGYSWQLICNTLCITGAMSSQLDYTGIDKGEFNSICYLKKTNGCLFVRHKEIRERSLKYSTRQSR